MGNGSLGAVQADKASVSQHIAYTRFGLIVASPIRIAVLPRAKICNSSRRRYSIAVQRTCCDALFSRRGSHGLVFHHHAEVDDEADRCPHDVLDADHEREKQSERGIEAGEGHRQHPSALVRAES